MHAVCIQLGHTSSVIVASVIAVPLWMSWIPDQKLHWFSPVRIPHLAHTLKQFLAPGFTYGGMQPTEFVQYCFSHWPRLPNSLQSIYEPSEEARRYGSCLALAEAVWISTKCVQ